MLAHRTQQRGGQLHRIHLRRDVVLGREGPVMATSMVILSAESILAK